MKTTPAGRSALSRIGLFCTVMALLLAAAVPPGAVAQTPAANLSGIAHVAIRVSDLAQSRAFFHKLGYEEAFAMNNGGSPTEAFFKINDRQFIELYPRRDASQSTGFMHICFETADINALYQDYVAHVLAPTPVKRAGAGNLLFTLQGPEQPGPASDLRPATTQNIEYTQYMPGSRHTLDCGQHLGANRIADRIAGVGIPMADPASATAFYIDKLSFQHAVHPVEPHTAALALPGAPDQRIELLPASASSGSLPFRLILSVPDLRRTAAQLHQLRLAATKSKSALSIQDPDGDQLIFIAGPKSQPAQP